MQMVIYTGTCGGAKLEKVKEYGLGVMVSPNAPVLKDYKSVPVALDNGAFAAYQRGFPFMEQVFWEHLNKAWKVGLKLDFIVCPDIVCGGIQSLRFSEKWALCLRGTPNLAIAVQDGIEPCRLTPDTREMFTHIFVGGSVEWKWKTAKTWVDFAHDHGMKCHIGRCGQLSRLRYAQDIGADSVDSTSITRNSSWHIIDELRGARQGVLSEENIGSIGLSQIGA